MRLSVLIPTYNLVCVSLVRQLQKQLPADAEIIVGDDGSTDVSVKQRNRAINDLKQCRLWEADENMGRSAIRNRLAQLSMGDYLLFIDSDASVISENFISKYLQHVSPNRVICGGILHPDTLPDPAVSLRYYYEKKLEPAFMAIFRNRAPYRSLHSFNLLVPRNVMNKCPFNEAVTQYGYEDCMLGREYENLGVEVLHIDAPLIHLGLEDNQSFLDKTEQAMQVLVDFEDKMKGYSLLMESADKLKRWHLTGAYKIIFNIFQPIIRKNLLSRKPNINLFQFWKMGVYLNRLGCIVSVFLLSTVAFSQQAEPQRIKVHLKNGDVHEYILEDVDYLEINDNNKDAISDTLPVIGGHVGKPVDLGLKVKWADINVGGKYDFSKGGYYSVTDNVASYWGDGWRLPTQQEWKELVTECTWEWAVQGGVSGRLITGRNGNTIFMPASGIMVGNHQILNGAIGLYATDAAMQWYFDSANVYDIELPVENRYTIRLVKP